MYYRYEDRQLLAVSAKSLLYPYLQPPERSGRAGWPGSDADLKAGEEPAALCSPALLRERTVSIRAPDACSPVSHRSYRWRAPIGCLASCQGGRACRTGDGPHRYAHHRPWPAGGRPLFHVLHTSPSRLREGVRKGRAPALTWTYRLLAGIAGRLAVMGYSAAVTGVSTLVSLGVVSTPGLESWLLFRQPATS